MALALQGRTALVVVAIVLIALGAFSFNHVSRSAENSGNAGALLSQLREENAALRTAVDRLEDLVETLADTQITQAELQTPASTSTKTDSRQKDQSASDKITSTKPQCQLDANAPIVRPQRKPIGKPFEIPRTIPPEAKDAMTLGGKAGVVYDYVKQDSIDNGNGEQPVRYYTQKQIDKWMEFIRRKETMHYLDDKFFYELLDAHADSVIRGKEIVVPGSTEPTYEALLFHYGAKHITTLEYATIHTTIPNHDAMLIEDFWKNPRRFDVAVAHSNFEHDGLGRYGDPLDPVGDLMAMEEMKQIVKPGGYLILSLPVGSDLILFNKHRYYGRARLPLMLKGWTIVAVYGFPEDVLDRKDRMHIQPFFLLKNTPPECGMTDQEQWCSHIPNACWRVPQKRVKDDA